jgi:hypothetical protein
MASSEHKTTLKILVVLTILFSFGSALCWAWAALERTKARDELTEAANRGDGNAMLRVPEWPALDWVIASFILLFLAVAVGAVTLFYWMIARRERLLKSS